MDTRYRLDAVLASFCRLMARTTGGMPRLLWAVTCFSGGPLDAEAGKDTLTDRGRFFRELATCLVLLTGSSVCVGANWANEMFDHSSHDFGTVATAAKVEHAFPFTNPYEEDVFVVSVKSSCGCSSVKAPKKVIKKFETAEILVSLDTRKFSKRKDAMITVEFQFEKMTAQGLRRSPKVEVRLQTYVYIRQDVVLTPGSAQFGSVREGTSARKEVKLAYAGSNAWKITAIEPTAPFVAIEVRETGRGHGLVNYMISIDLKDDAPTGFFREQVTLLTNESNPGGKRVPLTVEGVIEPAVSVNPSPLSFGIVEPDRTVTKNIVLTADSPFKVIEVTCPDDRLQFTVTQKAKTSLVRVVFTPDARRGPFESTILIQTDIPNHETLDLAVNGRVGSAEEDSPQETPPEADSTEELGKESSSG